MVSGHTPPRPLETGYVLLKVSIETVFENVPGIGTGRPSDVGVLVLGSVIVPVTLSPFWVSRQVPGRLNVPGPTPGRISDVPPDQVPVNTRINDSHRPPSHQPACRRSKHSARRARGQKM